MGYQITLLDCTIMVCIKHEYIYILNVLDGLLFAKCNCEGIASLYAKEIYIGQLTLDWIRLLNGKLKHYGEYEMKFYK